MRNENPFLTAVRGKGIFNAGRRATKIIQNLGFSPKPTLDTLQKFCELLQEFNCRATWTIPAVLVSRYGKQLVHFQDQGIEFAIHGFRHIDYSGVSKDIQCDHLHSAREIFANSNMDVSGYRGPYLHPINPACLRENGLLYDSSQAVFWPILGSRSSESYLKALQFYGAEPTSTHPSLPSLADNIVHIPYSLPDDEALVERLKCSPVEMKKIWFSILEQTQDAGALFVLGLHPERFMICREALHAVLQAATKPNSNIWISTLAEIAQWWRSFSETELSITELDANTLSLAINSTAEVKIIARGVGVSGPSKAIYDDYVLVEEPFCQISFDKRPFIGFHPDAKHEIALFFRQLGYIVEESVQPEKFHYYFEPSELSKFEPIELALQIEEIGHPLAKLSLWPGGARSALAVSGDIDAITSWDYVWRMLKK